MTRVIFAAAKPCPFKVGDRVRSKTDKSWIGVVAHLPAGPVIALGPHVLGNELAVDMLDGGRAVADVDGWEAM